MSITSLSACGRLCLLAAGLLLAGASAGAAADAPVAPAPLEAPATGEESNDSPAARAVRLRYRFVVGEESRQRLRLEGKGTVTTGTSGLSLPLTVALELAVSQKVRQVGEDGAAVLEAVNAFQKAQVNGLDLTAVGTAFPKVTAVVTPRGQVREVKAVEGAPSGAMVGVDVEGLASLTQRLAFPDREVKVGESWSAEGLPADAEYRATTTLVAVEETKGRRIARLKQVSALPIRMQAPSMLGPTAVNGRQAADLLFDFDVDAGRIVSANGSVDSTVTIGGPAAMTMRLQLKLHLETPPADTVSSQATPG